MRSWATLGLLLLLGLTRFAVAETAEGKPKKEVGPVEIDFSPLPAKGTDERYKLYVSIETANGTRFKTGYNVGAGSSPVAIRDTIKASMPEGWNVRAVGDDKLVVENYKGNPVRTVEIKADGLPKGQWPVARHLPKKEK